MDRVCPRDFTLLTAHEREGTTFFYCGTCHGVLLARSEMHKALAVGVRPELGRPAEEPTFEDGSAVCSCSGQTMTTLLREGVAVDFCQACETLWFDGGELERMAAARRSRLSSLPISRSPDTFEKTWTVLDAIGTVLWILDGVGDVFRWVSD